MDFFGHYQPIIISSFHPSMVKSKKTAVSSSVVVVEEENPFAAKDIVLAYMKNTAGTVWECNACCKNWEFALPTREEHNAIVQLAKDGLKGVKTATVLLQSPTS